MRIEQDLYMCFFQANEENYSVSASFPTSSYVGSANNYGNQMQEQNLESPSVTAQCPTQTLPSRPKTQRPRVPPPSKVSIKHYMCMSTYWVVCSGFIWLRIGISGRLLQTR
jgi:hypothetical protein